MLGFIRVLKGKAVNALGKNVSGIYTCIITVKCYGKITHWKYDIKIALFLHNITTGISLHLS